MRGATLWNSLPRGRPVQAGDVHERERCGVDRIDVRDDVFHPSAGDGFGQPGDGVVRRGATHGDVN